MDASSLLCHCCAVGSLAEYPMTLGAGESSLPEFGPTAAEEFGELYIQKRDGLKGNADTYGTECAPECPYCTGPETD